MSTKHIKLNQKIAENISVLQLFDMFKDILELEIIAGKSGMDRIIPEASLNRPALAITGFYKNFAASRIQLFGAGEMAYLRDLSETKQEEVMKQFASKNIPCVVISRDLVPTPAMAKILEEQNIPLIRTKKRSKEFSSELLVRLERYFAPQTSIHGTFLDVKGIGTLIRGDSGIGKSECALALIDRGHSLVADDLVYCVRINDQKIIGKSGEINRGYMECRGIGIINIAKLFGIRSVRIDKAVDIVVSFVEWTSDIVEDRTGLEIQYFDILGIKIPHFIMPVKLGRDMSRLVEVAARVHSLRLMGHDGAKDFNDRLIAHMANSQNK